MWEEDRQSGKYESGLCWKKTLRSDGTKIEKGSFKDSVFSSLYKYNHEKTIKNDEKGAEITFLFLGICSVTLAYANAAAATLAIPVLMCRCCPCSRVLGTIYLPATAAMYFLGLHPASRFLFLGLLNKSQSRINQVNRAPFALTNMDVPRKVSVGCCAVFGCTDNFFLTENKKP